MNRPTLAIATLVVSTLSGCSGAAPAATPTPARAPTPSPAPTATPAPTASPAPTLTASAKAGSRELPAGALEAGATYTGVFEGRTRYTFTIPASGWSNYPEAGCCVIYQGGDADGAIIFLTGDIASLYAEACHSSGTEFEFGPAVDDLANALVSLQDFEVSEPTEVTLSGFHGKRVMVTVPLGVDVGNAECDEGNYFLLPGRHYQATGQTDDSWILDVAGKRIVPTFATTPNTPADVLEQVEQIRNSLVIEPL